MNPITVTVASDAWQLATANIRNCVLGRLKSNVNYYWTYVLPGDTAPTSSDFGVALFVNSESEVVNTGGSKDIYVRTDGGEGSLRLDNGDISAPALKTAFQEQITAQYSPMVQWTFPYNINPGLVTETTVDSGGITGTTGKAVLSTGTDSTGSAKIQSIKTCRYSAGVAGVVRFTATFAAPLADLVQLVGLFDDDNGWAVGYNGEDFGFLRRSGGTDTWVYQDAWNMNAMSNLDPEKGNVYQIDYQWLGYGVQSLSIEDEKGNIALAHEILYANTSVDPSVTNPHLPMTASITNSGSTVDSTLTTTSATAGLYGDSLNDAGAVQIAQDMTEDTNDTTINLIAFHNPTIYKTKANRLFVDPLSLNVGLNATKTCTIKMYLGGAIVYNTALADIDGDRSPLQFSSDITSYDPATATLIDGFSFAKDSTEVISLHDSVTRIYPGQTVVLVLETLGVGTEISLTQSFKQYV